MEENKKVGIWLRVSTSMQVEETDSLEHHETRARAYCEAKGWKVDKVYALEGISGKSVLETPQAKEMLADIKAGNISTLIFSSLSRLARNTKELLLISEIFQKHNASLVSLKESIDTDSPAGRLFFTVLSALATFEVEEISARVKASVPVRAKLGKSLGGVAPFGYKWVNNKLILDEKEAPIRKEMFDLYKEHKRKSTVAKILNNKGYRTRKGSKFRDITIERLLTDTIVKGTRRVNYSSLKDNEKILKPESEWVFVETPRIVSDELFDEVNAIIKSQTTTRKKASRVPKHIFSGLVYCCNCNDEKMRVYSSVPDKYTCPKCRAKIPKTDLEEIYKSQIKNYILNPKALSKYLEQVNHNIKNKIDNLKILKDEKTKLELEHKKLYKLYMDDGISISGFERLAKPIDERLDELENLSLKKKHK